jgi:enterochelin esterase-like enzyme/membrane associated rhomboid family serine protease
MSARRPDAQAGPTEQVPPTFADPPLTQAGAARRSRRRFWPTGFRFHPPIITVMAIAGVVSTAARTGVFHHNIAQTVVYQYGYDGRQIQAGHWSTLFTSQLLTRNTFMTASICLSLLVFLGAYEALAGSWRAAIVVVVCSVAGLLIVETALGLGNVLGSTWAEKEVGVLDFGASAITAGAGGAVVALLRWRWLRIVGILIIISGLILHNQLADWEHLVAFSTGFGLGLILGPKPDVAGAETGSRQWGSPFAWALIVPAAVIGVFGAGAFVPSNAGTNSAQVIDTTYPSAALHANRRVLVVLPKGYDAHQRYPVVQLLQGTGGLDEVVGSLNVPQLSTQSRTPFIAVAPDGTGPAVSESDFANTSRQPMGTATGPELRQWVDSHYSTNGTWVVTGLSEGGYGAAYLPTLSPGAYQATCPMSGFFTAEDPAFQGQSAAVKRDGSPILHVSRTGPRTLLIAGASDKELIGEANRYIAAMKAVGQPNNGLILNPGGHELPVWTAGIKQCLGYFFPASGLGK